MNKYKSSSYLIRLLPIILAASFIAGLLFLFTTTEPALAFSGEFALEFDGVTDYVDLPLASEIIGTNWQSTKTITLWVKPAGPARPVADVVDGDLIFGDRPRWCGIYQASVGGEDRIWVWNHDNDVNNDDGVGLVALGIPYEIGEWVHIALVHGDDTLTAYKNGVEIDSAYSHDTAFAHPNALTGLAFNFGGNESLGGGGYDATFSGQIDEVRIYSTTLTTAEIRQDMYRTLSGSNPFLGAYYQMSDGGGGIGDTVTDDSGNGNDGVLMDGGSFVPPDGDTAEWITSGAFAGPRNALDFDGSNDYVSVPADIAMPANLTLEAWVYPRDTSSGQKWIAGEASGAQLTLDGTQAQFRINDGGLQGPATASLVANEWQHIAGTYNGTDLRIYV